jgi:hypothetical protein
LKRTTEKESARLWHIQAELVLAGTDKDIDRSGREALAIGFRCYSQDRTCAAALNKIDPERKFEA